MSMLKGKNSRKPIQNQFCATNNIEGQTADVLKTCKNPVALPFKIFGHQ